MPKYEIYYKKEGVWVKLNDVDAKVDKSGDTMSGTLMTTANPMLNGESDTGEYKITVCADHSYAGVPSIRIHGKSHATRPGEIWLDANNGTQRIVKIKPDGHLSWSGTSLDVGVNSSHNSFIQQVDDGNQGSVFINGGYGTTGGAYIALNGKSKATYPGVFGLYASDGSNSSQLTGYPDGTLTWRGKNIPVPDSDGTNGQVLTSNGTSKPEWKTITGTPYYTHNIVLKNTVTGGNIEMVAFRFTNTVSTAYTTQKTISQALYALGHKGETTAIPASGRYSTSDTYYLMAYGASGSYAQIWILSSNTNAFGTSGWESITDTVTRSA